MKPASFHYVAPASLAEALAAMADDELEVKILAGGQSLIPMMNFRLARPELLVDLRRVDGLGRVRLDGGDLRVGATVTQAALAAHEAVRERWPILAAGIGQIGHPQIRGRGTVCGSLAHHDPAAELPAIATLLDARLEATGPDGARTIPARDFFLSYLETALEPEEILVEAVFPALPERTGWSVREVARRRGDFALAGAAATVARDGGAIGRARVVLFGVGSAPVEVDASTLHGRAPDDEALRDLRAAVADGPAPADDVHASAEYRREAAAVLAARAVREAWERSS